MNTQLLNGLLDVLNDIILEIDQDHAIASVNHAWQEHTGYDKSDTIGKPVDDFLFFPGKELLIDLLKSQPSENPETFKVLLRHRSSSLKLFKISIWRATPEKNTVVLLAPREEYFGLGKERINGAWVVVDQQFMVVTFEKEATHELHLSTKLAIGQSIDNVLKPEMIEPQRFRQFITHMLQQEQVQFDMDIPRDDFQDIKTSVHLFPMFPSSPERYILFYIAANQEERKAHLNFSTEQVFSYMPSEYSSDIIFEVNTEGIIVDMHQQKKDPSDLLSHLHVVGKDLKGLLPAELAETCLQLIKDSIEKQVLNKYQYPMLVNGLLCWFELYIVRKSDREAIVLIKDVNQVYEANRKLKESEERYRLLAENASDVITLLDMSLHFRYFSPSVERFLGYTAVEMMERSIKDIMVPDSIDLAYQKHSGRKSEDEIIYSETLYIRKDGSLVWGENTTTTLRNQENEVIGYLINTRDISERKRAQEALKESERKLKDAQRVARMGYYEFNYQTKQVNWSDELLEILGMKPEEVGTDESTMWKLVHPDDQNRVKEMLQAYEEEPQGDNVKEDYRMCLPNGKILHVSGIYQLATDDHGRPYKAIGIVQDISERKRAEARIARQNRELRKLNKELDNLIYSSSHDLRSPLSSSLGLLNLIRLEPDQKQKDAYLDLMEKSLKRLDSFTKDILDLYQNARTQPKKEVVNIQTLLEQVLDECRFMDQAKDIRFEIDIKQQGTFCSEGRRLKIILSNLVTNAIRYHNLHQENPWVRIKGVVESGGVIIEVADNGQGIESSHLEKIFQMFYRANPVKKGSGLGLYLVSETIDKLKGTLKVSSTYGQGSSFYLSIPSLR